jgi:hypothetical protein
MTRTWTTCALLVVLTGLAIWAGGGGVSRRVTDTGAPVIQIFPTADRLPSNLLRVYVVFDRPMSTGEARAHLRLLDDTGRDVDRAFLQLDEELWDPSGRRLTVLFDPGRIKRGLRANLESGPPLVEGHRYRLVVDAGWREADGRPIGTGASKDFDAVAADRTAPVVDDWTIDPPPAGTRAPLVVRFPEVLDRALLSSAIAVVDGSGEAMRGEIDVTPGERTWTFTPHRAWRDGSYELRVASELEDVAGNSLRRVFDAEVTRSRRATAPAGDAVVRPFHVNGSTESP